MLSFIPYVSLVIFFSFFFNDTATTEIYTLSLHDALPISDGIKAAIRAGVRTIDHGSMMDAEAVELLRDRKSTRLNSSHVKISYAVFCLKKKKKKKKIKLIIRTKIIMIVYKTMIYITRHYT